MKYFSNAENSGGCVESRPEALLNMFHGIDAKTIN